jgi:glycosyltransferase involved in cell wall biosynthesis
MRANIPVLIPAYNPPSQLVELVRVLLDSITSTVIIVNDGSSPEFREIFEQIKNLSGVIYLEHQVNLGKGQALKTGFRALEQIPSAIGIVTADADGQHAPEDIGRVILGLIDSPNSLFLGIRQLNKNIPWRSRFGNQLTRRVFGWLTGMKLQDTQTGLRGMPRSFVSHLVTLSGNAYDYEMNMLVTASRMQLRIVEIPIQTIYLSNNQTSHFKPFIDSMKIYWVLLRYVASSLLTAITDLLLFNLLIIWSMPIVASMILSRFLAGTLVNFCLNRSWVFRSRSVFLRSLLRYYIVVVTSGLLVGLATQQIHQVWGFSPVIVKIFLDIILFFPLFALQRKYVFGGHSSKR